MNKNPYIHHKKIHNIGSAKRMVDFIYELFRPTSVVDFGCGVGNFLYAFKELGVKSVLGLDGEWVNKNQLSEFLQSDEFRSVDLTSSIDVGKNYGIALSLEVAEHLSDKSATQFIKNITKASEIVVFSAAVPYQGGQNHLNEQWPEYWERIFEEFGYEKYDLIRPLIWNEPDIPVWYKQNTFVYVKGILDLEIEKRLFQPNTRFIHPDLYHYKAKQLEIIQSGKYTFDGYLRIFGKAVLRFLKLYNK